ncbi:MAG: ligase-associated DNA damage response exonuclease [Bacteroidota bacterium]
MSLLRFTNKGIYCEQADVYIDPWKPVNRALITHGHSDHARWGNKHYLCTDRAAPVIRYRLGNEIQLESVPFGKKVHINGVQFSFHPAGHIIGSAQIRVEYKGEVWVASGDYKLEDDGLSYAYEPIKCHAFITESTFGLPVYKWQPQEEVFEEINAWWRSNQEQGKVSLLTAYSLGKAQRLLQGLDHSIGKVYTHGAIENTNAVLRKQGIQLPTTIRVYRDIPKNDYNGQLVLAPPSAVNSTWARRFKLVSVGIASGWMAIRGMRRRRAVDRGFLLSDHADWEGLNTAVRASGASRVYVTHGYTSIYARWLQEQGLDATAVKTEYEGERLETPQPESED